MSDFQLKFLGALQKAFSDFEKKKDHYYSQCTKLEISEYGCFPGIMRTWKFTRESLPPKSLCQYDICANIMCGSCAYWTFFRNDVALGQLCTGTNFIKELNEYILK